MDTIDTIMKKVQAKNYFQKAWKDPKVAPLENVGGVTTTTQLDIC